MTTEEKKEIIKKSFDDFIDKVDLLTEEEIVETGISMISILDFADEKDVKSRLLGFNKKFLFHLLIEATKSFL